MFVLFVLAGARVAARTPGAPVWYHRSLPPRPAMPPEIDPSWTSLLPPILAIGLAIWTRQVYLSLGAGVWLGFTILNGWNPLAGLGGAIEGAVGVFADAGNTRVLLFTLVIGALIATVEAGGGVKGFVEGLERRGWASTPRGARMLSFLVGRGHLYRVEHHRLGGWRRQPPLVRPPAAQ